MCSSSRRTLFSMESVTATIKRGSPQTSPGPAGRDISISSRKYSSCLRKPSVLSRNWQRRARVFPVSSGRYKQAPISRLSEQKKDLLYVELRRGESSTGTSVINMDRAYGSALLFPRSVRATLGHQQGGAILAFDAKNMFMSSRRSTIVPTLGTLIPLLVPHVLKG